MGKYSVYDFLNAIPGSGGHPARIAERIGCARGTVENYLQAFTRAVTTYRTEVAEANAPELPRADMAGLASEDALICAMLDLARRDALAGDMAAAAWLADVGADMADALAPGTGHAVRALAAEIVGRASKGDLITTWGQ